MNGANAGWMALSNASDDSNEGQSDCSNDATGFALYCVKTRNRNRWSVSNKLNEAGEAFSPAFSVDL